jgi:hypothetical protein
MEGRRQAWKVYRCQRQNESQPGSNAATIRSSRTPPRRLKIADKPLVCSDFSRWRSENADQCVRLVASMRIDTMME